MVSLVLREQMVGSTDVSKNVRGGPLSYEWSRSLGVFFLMQAH